MNSRQGVETSNLAFRHWLKAHLLTSRDFGKLAGVHESIVSRWGRHTMPTHEHQFLVAKITKGDVLPNDWFADLTRPDQVIGLTRADIDRLGRGERVIPKRPSYRRRRIVLVMQQ